MRIACPSCNAAYQVPDVQMTAGRVVRCARCGAEWSPVVADPEEPDNGVPSSIPEPTPEPVSDPAPATAAEPAAAAPVLRMALDDEPIPPPVPPLAPLRTPSPSRRLPALATAWVVSLAVVASALAGLVVRRDDVMRVWPPSARAYVALGLATRP